MPSLSLLIGKPISHVWFGDYSALYLELGELAPGHVRRDGSLGNPIGEVTVYVGFDWRIERKKAAFITSQARPIQYDALIEQFKGAAIVSISLSSSSKELEILFSNSNSLVTQTSDSPDPEWSVGFNVPSMGHLSVEKGILRHDRRSISS